MTLIAGIAGATRNAATALCEGGRVVAVCEQERVTRTRRAGLHAGRLPQQALETVLRVARRKSGDISAYAIAESGIQLPNGLSVARIDHHYGHAATSFYTSPFDEAAIIICDRHGLPELTVWRGENGVITRDEFPWVGPAFATVYSQAAEAIGFGLDGDEHRLDALAQVGRPVELALPPVTYCGDRLAIPSSYQATIANLVTSNGHDAGVARTASLAAAVQRQLGDLLMELLGNVKRRGGSDRLCLGGGFFYNSYFNSRVAASRVYERVFVPINPGNAGVSVGAALALAGNHHLIESAPLSPFLGPGFELHEIKTTLDNCKLSYDLCREDQAIDRTVGALAKGALVGWFQGRMEWGPRALGNRSILASPVAPYVLDNLNVFLKRRESYRPYSVSVCEEDVSRLFEGPSTSPFMEYEYDVVALDRLRPVLPLDAGRLRVQTVPQSAGMFYRLIKAFGEVTGVPMLVNTSFNGFNEPIVCTPRDALRVFYGTGLDVAVLGSFMLRK